MESDNIYLKFPVSTILGLFGTILWAIAIILHMNDYTSIIGLIGIILIIIAIFSSFYVNKNNKVGSILLIIVGILIFFYSVEFFNPYQISYYNNLTYTRVPIESAIIHNLGVLSGIIIFISGIIGVIKKKIVNED